MANIADMAEKRRAADECMRKASAFRRRRPMLAASLLENGSEIYFELGKRAGHWLKEKDFCLEAGHGFAEAAELRRKRDPVKAATLLTKSGDAFAHAGGIHKSFSELLGIASSKYLEAAKLLCEGAERLLAKAERISEGI